MPGPMLAWARSTGAMLPRCKFLSAAGNSARSAFRNWRREAIGASTGRGRQTRTMDDARALVPKLTLRFNNSVRIGHVPVIVKKALIKPSKIVYQAVEGITFVLLIL